MSDHADACGENHILALWLDPESIRNAFADGPDDENPTVGLTDDQLLKVSYFMLDAIYEEYRRLLDQAFAEGVHNS